MGEKKPIPSAQFVKGSDCFDKSHFVPVILFISEVKRYTTYVYLIKAILQPFTAILWRSVLDTSGMLVSGNGIKSEYFAGIFKRKPWCSLREVLTASITKID